MTAEYECEVDGIRYRIRKLPLRRAQQSMELAIGLGVFSAEPKRALCKDATGTEKLEDALFGGGMVTVKNDSGHWVPVEIIEGHFDGRMRAYLSLLLEAVEWNFADFLGDGGGTPPPEKKTSPPPT